jgi:hypothetical protein
MRRACSCSETDFSSENGDLAWKYITEEQRYVVFFLWEKGHSEKDIHRKVSYVEKCLSRKAVPHWWQTFL